MTTQPITPIQAVIKKANEAYDSGLITVDELCEMVEEAKLLQPDEQEQEVD